jgi:hypothetical protein
MSSAPKSEVDYPFAGSERVVEFEGNWKKSLLYDFYMAIGVYAYRENRIADHYQGLHFGLIDIVKYEDLYTIYTEQAEPDAANLDVSSDVLAGERERRKGAGRRRRRRQEARGSGGQVAYSGGAYGVVMRVVDSYGNTAITKRVPLRARRNVSAADTGMTYTQPSDGDGTAGDEGFNSMPFECVAVWGTVPEWRILLSKALLMAIPFTVFGIPLMTILWFFAASVLYIVWGSEEKRCARLMQQAEKAKKMD